MASKLEAYLQLADDTSRQITGSYQTWTDFLGVAGRLYKYPFPEQLMIYAQRPDATACAEYDFWNQRMRRYIRRGAKGIALIDTSQGRPVLRYVFDVSDTGRMDNGLNPNLWQYRAEHHDAVAAALESRFDVPANPDLEDQLEQIAALLAREYWNDHQYDILRNIDDSFLEGYDAFNVGAAFQNAASVSITYTLMSRCGLEPEDHFQHEDFLSIFDFNTRSTVTALGMAVSQSSEQVLRQIEVTVKKYEREKIAGRSAEYGPQSDLHPSRGLPDSQSRPAGAAGPGPGQVRQDAPAVSEGTPARTVGEHGDGRDTVQPPVGDRGHSQQPVRTDDAPADEGGGSDRAVEGQRPDEVGRADEQLQGTGGGDYSVRADLQLSLLPPEIPSQQQQIESIREAESVATPSAFVISQADIDAELRRGMPYKDGKIRVYAMYQQEITARDAIKTLKKEYGTSGHSHIFSDGRNGYIDYSPSGGMKLRCYRPAADVKLTWAKVEKRIRQMVQEGSYLTPTELEKYQSDHLEQPPELETKPPAPASRGITDADVDKLLIEDWGAVGRKQRIFALYRLGLSNEQIADHLRSEYNKRGYSPEERAHEGPCVLADGGEGYGYFVAAEWRLRRRDVDGPMRHISFEELAGHIRTLIDQGRYLTPEELAQVTTVANQEQTSPIHVPGATPPIPASAPMREVTQADIDTALQEWNGDIASKRRVQEYMTAHARDKGTAQWLKNEYGDNFPAYPVHAAGGGGTDLPWSKVQRHLARLVKEDRFFTETELNNFEDINAAAVREHLEQAGDQPSPSVEEIISDVNQLSAGQDAAPTVRGIYGHFKPIVRDLVLADAAYQNACKNSDRENAIIEGDAAVKRTALTITEPEFMRLYHDMPAFRYRLHREIVDETYAALTQPQQEQNAALTHDTTDYEEETPPWGTEVGDHSPWGKVQESSQFAEGVYEISTAGHGGIMIREPDAKKLLSPETIAAGGSEYGWLYYEEDAAAPVVIRELLDRGIPAAPPYVRCDYSETHEFFEENKIYSVHEFDSLMKQADDRRVAGKKAAIKKYGTEQRWIESKGPEFDEFFGYDKVSFVIVMPDGAKIWGRQDVGDGYGGLLDYLSQNEKYRDIVPFLREAAEREQAETLPPDLSDQPVTREGDTLTIGSGDATHEVDITVSNEEWQTIQEVIGAADQPAHDPLAPPYKVGDTVYLDNTAFEITDIGLFDVELRDPALPIPLLRTESKENFERLLHLDSRNGPITSYLPANMSRVNDDFREVLVSHLLTDRDKDYISGWIRSGQNNRHISMQLSCKQTEGCTNFRHERWANFRHLRYTTWH